MRNFKKQIEEAEEIAALNLAKFRKAQVDVEEAEERADLSEQALAKFKAMNKSSRGTTPLPGQLYWCSKNYFDFTNFLKRIKKFVKPNDLVFVNIRKQKWWWYSAMLLYWKCYATNPLVM